MGCLAVGCLTVGCLAVGGLDVECLRSCRDCTRSEFLSLVESSKLLAGLVNKVGGEENHPEKGEVEDEVPKQI